MARTVVAIYDDFETADQAVRDLVNNGFPRDNISIIANNTRGEYAYNTTTPTATTTDTTNESVANETGAGVGVGAGIGAAIGGIGGLLIGLGALTIPGIGPVLAAGPLAVALSTLTGAGVGAVAGGVTGGLLGALIGLGIPEEEAEYYAEGVRRGGVLVSIQSEDKDTDQIMNILNENHPMDINQRAAQWREQGWSGFNADETQPVSAKANPPANTVSTDNERTVARQAVPDQAAFNQENPNLRNHYNTYLSNTGYPYDYFVPAYQYGYGMARDARYQNSTWAVVEPDVQHNWELEHPGTWDRFKVAIQHSWEEAKMSYRGPQSDFESSR